MEYQVHSLIPPISVKFRDEVDMTIFETLLKMDSETIYVATAWLIDEKGVKHFCLQGFDSLFACQLFDWRNDMPIN
jgi:hypothetical protein